MAENLTEWAIAYAKPMISTGLEQLVDKVTPGLTGRFASDPNAHDEHIAVLGLAASEADKMLADAVLAARNSGRTWSQIAEALGIDRAAAQARFSADAPAVTQVGASAILPLLDGEAIAASSGSRVGDVRCIQFSKWGRVTDLNLLGAYGWRAQAVELTSDWTAGIATAELDTQQWEYAVTKRKKQVPDGLGWTRIEGPGAWTGGIYWGRPTGQSVKPGNPEPKVLLGLAN